MKHNMSDYISVKKIYTDYNQCSYSFLKSKVDSSLIVAKSAAHYDKAHQWFHNEFNLLEKKSFLGILVPQEVVKINDAWTLIYKKFSGAFLKVFLKDNDLNLEQFLKIAIQICAISHELHQQSIIHSSLNFDSILIDPITFKIQITNFNVATRITKNCYSLNKDLSGVDVAYISPEQTGRTNYPIDYRSDLYSLGIIFYKLLTNSLPFQAKNEIEYIHYHLAQTPLSPDVINSKINPVIASIIMKLLEKDPKSRYQSAWGIQKDLEKCQIQYKKHKTINYFELSILDSYSKFKKSPKIYGRENSEKTIIQSLDRSYLGAVELILIFGQVGIGKTSLAEYVISKKVQDKGIFLQSKLEEKDTKIPYSGIKKVLGIFVERLLALDKISQQEWQHRILNSLGHNAQILINIIPDIEIIIGSQPGIPDLPTKEAENRFNVVFTLFIKILATKEHPLIIFFDDSQWLDSASFNLLRILIDTNNIQYLSVVLTFQEQDKELSHKANKELSTNLNLINFIDSIKNSISSSVRTNYIKLKPISLNAINDLIKDTFNSKAPKSLGLAKLISNRTQGNPLFIHELLQDLNDHNLIRFDYQEVEWRWSLQEIALAPINPQNLLELFIERFQKLSHYEQLIIQSAACFGKQFDLSVLKIVARAAEDTSIVDQAINISLQLGLIFILHRNNSKEYEFSDNRIRQIIYDSLSEEEKIKIHYSIACYFIRSKSQECIEENIFEIVYHVNFSLKLVRSSKEKQLFARLNLTAARKSKLAIAYTSSNSSLEIALELLDDSNWIDNYDLMLAVHLELIEIHYLRANFTEVQSLSSKVVSYINKIEDIVCVYELVIRSQIATNQMKSAIDTCWLVLNLLDIDFLDLHCQELLKNKYLNIDNSFLEKLERLPKLTYKKIFLQVKILSLMIPPLYITQSDILPSIIFRTIELFIKYGNSNLSSYIIALYGLLLCNEGKIDVGYQAGKLALSLKEKFVTPELNPKVDFIFNNTISHWYEPQEKSLTSLSLGIKSSIEVGDIEHACFSAKYYCVYLFFTGKPLEFVVKETQFQIETIANFKQDFQLGYTSIWQQLNLNLRGKAKNSLLLVGDAFDEIKIVTSWQENNNATSLFAFYLAKLILCYHLKEYYQAVDFAREAKRYLNAAVGTICFAMYHFYTPLAILAFEKSIKRKKSKSLLYIAEYQKKLKTWSQYSPINYSNKYYLVTAEIYAALGKDNLAGEYYDRAIDSAIKADYIPEIALAEELAGEFYLLKNRKKIAGYYLSQAYKNYYRWQASAKLTVLERNYSNLISIPDLDKIESQHTKSVHESISPSKLSSIDFMSMLKASQAISSEIVLENLLSKMIQIVTENVGAQRGILLLNQHPSWNVVATASISRDIDIDTKIIPLESYQAIPQSLINYIQSTRRTVVIDSALENSLFKEDDYIVRVKPKSILACPLIYKHGIQGILYLENNLLPNAFDQENIDVLQVLLTQVSISIENARLYKNLEDSASVKKSLKQKEILLKEIHHRVKNNLFVVSSLLDFQSNYIEDLDLIKVLHNCQNRIYSMALIHQHLYGSKELNKINLSEYIESLLDSLSYSQASKERNINLTRDLDSFEINIETATPCGLIVNELVSNALEHAFKHTENGNIWLTLKQDLGGQITLTVQDDGVGFKQGLTLENSDSLGLELVSTLAAQLDGEILLDCTKGTKIEITFYELSYDSRI